ncbi:hypothetical protein SLA2020_367090 [Shorea laevis]
MKRPKSEPPSVRRFKLSHLLLGIAVLYLVFISFKFPQFIEIAAMLSGDDTYVGLEGTMERDSEDSDLSKPFFGSVLRMHFTGN